MPKELKNSAATLQRKMKEVLADQKGQNVEIHLEEIVIKRKSELHLDGVRADLEKVHAIILNLTPKSPNQIRSLFLQLAAISKFIPKMVELQYLIHKVRMRFETTQGSGWTNEAKKALQRRKRKLNKLQTLAGLKEGLAISVSNGMKYLHVFMDSPKLVAQTEGNHTPTTEQERKYKKEIMEATTPFHKFRIMHLPNNLNSKA
nr:hypothetical protein [Tanacetum cinerariifolium]